MLEKYNSIKEKYGLIVNMIFIILLSGIGLKAHAAGNTVFPVLVGILILVYVADIVKRSIKYIK